MRRAGRVALIGRLAARSDVVVENFKAGDLKRYGLDQATLRAAVTQAMEGSDAFNVHQGTTDDELDALRRAVRESAAAWLFWTSTSWASSSSWE